MCLKEGLTSQSVSRRNTLDFDKPFDTEIAEWLLDNLILTHNAQYFYLKRETKRGKIIYKIGIKALGMTAGQ